MVMWPQCQSCSMQQGRSDLRWHLMTPLLKYSVSVIQTVPGFCLRRVLVWSRHLCFGELRKRQPFFITDGLRCEWDLQHNCSFAFCSILCLLSWTWNNQELRQHKFGEPFPLRFLLSKTLIQEVPLAQLWIVISQGCVWGFPEAESSIR